tara:strand:+ start:458 stop:667 length:210 start_codon:yes stop_codon:yes gene_type:complete
MSEIIGNIISQLDKLEKLLEKCDAERNQAVGQVEICKQQLQLMNNENKKLKKKIISKKHPKSKSKSKSK